MAFSKVTLNGSTLMDVTDKTVTEETLLRGETALAANGQTIVGTHPSLTSEVIRDYTTTEDATTVTIDTDSSGNSFALRMAKIMVVLPASSTGNADWVLAQSVVRKTDNTTYTLGLPTLKMNTASKSLNVYEFEAYGGMYFTRGWATTQFGSTGNAIYSYAADILIQQLESFTVKQYSASTTIIPSGTRIIIQGIRA